MKVQSFLIASLTVALGAVIASPAMAQEEAPRKDSRFHFEPNVYGGERGGARRSNHYSGPIGTVSHGSVPKGIFGQGVSPSIFNRPAPVAAVPQVQTNVFPQIVAQQPVPFQNVFGKPMTAAPMTAKPMTMSQVPAPKSAPRTSSSRAVAGRVLSPRRSNGLVARSAPMIQSMPGSGFKQGTYIPTSSGGGFSSTTSVTGVIHQQK
ncbi:MAG: hypothetical protein IPP97_00550 [Candidatus Obscuribacter sp.]|jgi:hypothetical protein|nr:hypothetical protein [Candidatus Obscuribacter sp.]MBP6351143.1 hypothetical protein [Candidatus Obscuribacter sp.]